MAEVEPPVDPDCRAGKHTACTGRAWDEAHDELTDCACGCHDEQTSSSQSDAAIDALLEVTGPAMSQLQADTIDTVRKVIVEAELMACPDDAQRIDLFLRAVADEHRTKATAGGDHADDE